MSSSTPQDIRRTRPPRILAIASGGGHWEQLMLLRPAFEGFETHYATTLAGLAEQSGVGSGYRIPDCNRNAKGRMLLSAVAILLLLVRLKPDVVVTTGALPGLLALWIAKKMGIRTAWIDSIANAEEMSLSGSRAASISDLWLTQWPEVARNAGAEYAGSVI